MPSNRLTLYAADELSCLLFVCRNGLGIEGGAVLLSGGPLALEELISKLRYVFFLWFSGIADDTQRQLMQLSSAKNGSAPKRSHRRLPVTV